MTKRRQRGEVGYTLTEVLVAVSILTVAIVVILGAMSAGIVASRVHRDIVTSDAVARRYAEQIVGSAYVPCATAASYPFAPPAGFTATITSIKYISITPAVTAPPTPATSTFVASCPSPDLGVQQITILAMRTTGGTGSQTLQILKRNT